jgi:hypothetical protein
MVRFVGEWREALDKGVCFGRKRQSEKGPARRSVERSND